MRAVLGIDAAWTIRQPSGVALAIETSNGWRLVHSASSFDAFISFAQESLGIDTDNIPGSNVARVLEASRRLCETDIDLVAVDMPLSKLPITARRVSDDEVSRAYGARFASTHTPSALRPGKISDVLRSELEVLGYSLQTTGQVTRGLVEVYPHPALIEFATAEKRLPYKHAKRSRYWPTVPDRERKMNIWREWRKIARLMDNEISGVLSSLPSFNPETARSAEWKAYEDMLDAIVCAAVGICVLEGRAEPFGDEESAIWIPKPGSAKPERRGIIGINFGAHSN